MAYWGAQVNLPLLQANDGEVVAGATTDVAIPATAKRFTINFSYNIPSGGKTMNGEFTVMNVATGDTGPHFWNDDKLSNVFAQGVPIELVEACAAGDAPTHIRVNNPDPDVTGQSIHYWLRFY